MKNFLLSGKRKFLTIPLVLFMGLVFLPITILLLIGWLIHTRVAGKKARVAGLGIVGILVLFFGAAYVSAIFDPKATTENRQNSKREQSDQEEQQEEDAESDSKEDIPAKDEPTATPAPSVKGQQVTPAPETDTEGVMVIDIIDGDTIEIEGGQKIRYIGVDTPERGACFASAATSKNSELVLGKSVRLEKDISETDRYGRLLRYVYINDIFVNQILVEEGYANAFSYPPDIKYQDNFRQAEENARNGRKGLWGTCNSTAPAKTQTNTSDTAPGTSVNEGTCKYSCSAPDRDCPDFASHTEAQTFFNCCGFTAENDPMKLDSVGVGDGIACESL